MHILPRSSGDIKRNDDVYTALEEWAPRPSGVPAPRLEVAADEDRRDRTREEMANEAAVYRKIAEKSAGEKNSHL